ncbi:MAG: ABC transporter C-terminal domain-containing protein [Halofilum sp. (in: g-proteobacteria)]|nr:ABC transporter C-terminal domain-containing protein [Halofilum sp. (in: g-proteobacteria)]
MQELGERLSDPALYREGGDPTALNDELGAAQAELERAFERWAELDARGGG